jgi:hypothetical protein
VQATTTIKKVKVVQAEEEVKRFTQRFYHSSEIQNLNLLLQESLYVLLNKY